jgi:cytochrome c5
VKRLRALTVLGLGAGAALGCAGGERPDPPPNLALGDDCPNDLPDDTACATAAPSYAEQTAAMIDQRCTVCHFFGNTQSTQIFETYDDVFDQKRGMLTQIYSCRMPPEGAVQLSSEERKALLQWFVCGAPDN